MKLDRDFQRRILTTAQQCYPKNVSYEEMQSLKSEERFIANAMYLQEHGLIQMNSQRMASGDFMVSHIQATASGMDFLADDGGLTAILGTVTIRFHDETLRALMADKIQASDLPQSDKRKLLDGLQSLSGEAIKHLTLKLLDKAVEKLPLAASIIGTYIQQHT